MAIRMSSMVSQTQSSFGIHNLILKGQFLMKFQTWQNFYTSFCCWYVGICRLDKIPPRIGPKTASLFKRSFKERYNLDQIEQCLVFTAFLSDRYLGNPTNVCVKQSNKKLIPNEKRKDKKYIQKINMCTSIIQNRVLFSNWKILFIKHTYNT